MANARNGWTFARRHEYVDDVKNPPLFAKIFTALFSSSMIAVYVLVMGGLLAGTILLPSTKSSRMSPERLEQLRRAQRESSDQQSVAADQNSTPVASSANQTREPFRFLPADSPIVAEKPAGKLQLLPGSKSAAIFETRVTSYASEPATRPAKLIWGSKSGRVIDASDISFVPGPVEFPEKKEPGQ